MRQILALARALDIEANRDDSKSGEDVDQLLNLAQALQGQSHCDFNDVIELALFASFTHAYLHTFYSDGHEDPDVATKIHFLSRTCHDIDDVTSSWAMEHSLFESALLRAHEEHTAVFTSGPKSETPVFFQPLNPHWVAECGEVDPFLRSFVVPNWIVKGRPVLKAPRWLYDLLTTPVQHSDRSRLAIFAPSSPHRILFGPSVEKPTTSASVELMQSPGLSTYSLQEIAAIVDSVASQPASD